MTRFNRPGVKPAVASPITTTGVTATSHYGSAGHVRDAKSDLFLLAVANMVGKDTYYETGGTRDDRYTALVRQVAVEDPDWLTRMLRWLRGAANMRTAAIVGAAEMVKARIDAKLDGHSRQAVDAVLQRADEPGEILGYWTSRYGRALPKPLKRGVADAVARLYGEYALAKYDTDSKGYRFGDVIDLVHPTPAADKPWQGDLFAYALDRRHDRDNEIPASLRTLNSRARLMALPADERRAILAHPNAAETLKDAGMTWEALAGWLQGPMDAAAWSAVIPSMGLFALARNLRNFDEAGVPDDVVAPILAKLNDAEQVRRSRMLPFRFLAAHRHAPSLRWSYPLEQALGHSLANVPALPGRTLVLVDRSPSMFPGYHFSTKNTSDIGLADQAAVFGAALALRAADAALVEYGGTSQRVDFRRGESLLKVVEKFGQISYTDTWGALNSHWDGHDRVVIVTDEQTAGTRQRELPPNVSVYTWNVAGYGVAHAPSGSGRRHTFGSLSDAAFSLIPLLEAGRDAAWPF